MREGGESVAYENRPVPHVRDGLLAVLLDFPDVYFYFACMIRGHAVYAVYIFVRSIHVSVLPVYRLVFLCNLIGILFRTVLFPPSSSVGHPKPCGEWLGNSVIGDYLFLSRCCGTEIARLANSIPRDPPVVLLYVTTAVFLRGLE